MMFPFGVDHCMYVSLESCQPAGAEAPPVDRLDAQNEVAGETLVRSGNDLSLRRTSMSVNKTIPVNN